MRIDLLQGTLDMLLLKSLSGGPMHGFAMVRWLETHTDGALSIDEGSLYPALHRMAARGWLSATWGLSESNRRAKYYALTAAGRQQLKTETDAWARYQEVVARVLRVKMA